jgi:hypothetical protein
MAGSTTTRNGIVGPPGRAQSCGTHTDPQSAASPSTVQAVSVVLGNDGDDEPGWDRLVPEHPAAANAMTATHSHSQRRQSRSPDAVWADRLLAMAGHFLSQTPGEPRPQPRPARPGKAARLPRECLPPGDQAGEPKVLLLVLLLIGLPLYLGHFYI